MIKTSKKPNNSKDLKNMIIKSILKQDGCLILRSHRETCGIQHLRLHQLDGNSTTIGSRTKVGILGDPQPGLNSSDFFGSEMLFFACRKVGSLTIDGVCNFLTIVSWLETRTKESHMCACSGVSRDTA